MINHITFSHNWNNKLNCKAFTTLRLHNDKKYQPGNHFQVFLKDGKGWKQLGYFILQEKRTFFADKINDFVGFLDTGYNAAETKKILNNMYKKPVDKLKVDLCLLVKIKEDQIR